ECLDESLDTLEQFDRHNAVSRARPAAESGEIRAGWLAGNHDVRFERGKSTGDDFAAESHDVVVRPQLRQPEHPGVTGPGRATMRPVQAHTVAHWPAEELIDRNAKR